MGENVKEKKFTVGMSMRNDEEEEEEEEEHKEDEEEDINEEELEKMRHAQRYFEGDEEDLKYSYSYPKGAEEPYSYPDGTEDDFYKGASQEEEDMPKDFYEKLKVS
eukprot:CAMPEP_0119052384 /NCGR_PEP_ID=MMETSP1177-20130426/73697_1 /TAXON_ID=2985 /ORGANISM="Ochromonas sp, Strain CCMP1899" /LENGTH=105 /DNA_ID=CAMNT_0007031935 /DNA_START=52 /DNA_END=370 /DNA_ORIENTATION=+